MSEDDKNQSTGLLGNYYGNESIKGALERKREKLGDTLKGKITDPFDNLGRLKDESEE